MMFYIPIIGFILLFFAFILAFYLLLKASLKARGIYKGFVKGTVKYLLLFSLSLFLHWLIKGDIISALEHKELSLLIPFVIAAFATLTNISVGLLFGDVSHPYGPNKRKFFSRVINVFFLSLLLYIILRSLLWRVGVYLDTTIIPIVTVVTFVNEHLDDTLDTLKDKTSNFSITELMGSLFDLVNYCATEGLENLSLGERIAIDGDYGDNVSKHILYMNNPGGNRIGSTSHGSPGSSGAGPSSSEPSSSEPSSIARLLEVDASFIGPKTPEQHMANVAKTTTVKMTGQGNVLDGCLRVLTQNMSQNKCHIFIDSSENATTYWPADSNHRNSLSKHNDVMGVKDQRDTASRNADNGIVFMMEELKKVEGRISIRNYNLYNDCIAQWETAIDQKQILWESKLREIDSFENSTRIGGKRYVPIDKLARRGPPGPSPLSNCILSSIPSDAFSGSRDS